MKVIMKVNWSRDSDNDFRSGCETSATAMTADLPRVFVVEESILSQNLRTRSDFEKHFTIKNCDKTFLKIISRLKKLLKSDVS